MDIIGIICEYNPFHNGHLYHIQKIKASYPDSLIILVLNGYFLERGEISVLTKEEKTKIALENNIDIVLELPVIFGTQSADTFASISLKILNNFHVNKLIFGSESNDINQIINIAREELNLEYNTKVKELLNKGINYPTALAQALNCDFAFLPNDLLAISYTKAILKNQYEIKPITIKRTNDYHDLNSYDSIISAKNIREKLKKDEDISRYVPQDVPAKILSINANNYFNLLKYKINLDNNLSTYLDVDEGIEFRLKKYINNSSSLDNFIEKIKTKRYTYNKLNRMLIHILISQKKDSPKNLEYIKILGFNKKGQQYLNSLKKLEISTIIKKDSLQYQKEIQASLIYDLINNTNTYDFELKNKPVIFD